MATVSPHPFEDRTSLTGSIGDFSDSDKPHSPLFGLPSQHSGFRSVEPSESEKEDDEIDGPGSDDSPWSPPGAQAWRQPSSASGWYRHQPYSRDVNRLKSQSASKSRRSSVDSEGELDEEDPDATLAAQIPLPRCSTSPMRESPARKSETRERSGSPRHRDLESVNEAGADHTDAPKDNLNRNNFLRLAVSAEVQQRTEPIEAVVTCLRLWIAYARKSWGSFITTLTMILLALSTYRILTQTPLVPPVPDLVKVANLVQSFEPQIYYSESGRGHIEELQETGMAVEDLGLSVHFSNMTSTSIMVENLDQLGDSLKTLSQHLNNFFANIDADIDGILIVMDWAKRRLAELEHMPSSSLSCAFANIHSLLSTAGIFESRSTGLQTPLGNLFTTLFGVTTSQRTHQTLHHTFNEIVTVLEESIQTELTDSTKLIALFESIDRQFLNLQRTVMRETDTQERLESEFLSTLWARIVGPNKEALKKYDKNKKLLASVRSRTTQNKSMLVDHNNRLQSLKVGLETLRRKLVSPLVSKTRENSRVLAVEEHIKGLEGTHDYLRKVREKQKERVLEAMYGAGGKKRSSIGREETTSIEG